MRCNGVRFTSSLTRRKKEKTMKKALILAIAIAAVLVLVGCNKKTQPLMPSQDFVGRWSDGDDSYSEISYINAEENKIGFEWFIVRTMNSAGTARLEDGKIKFVLDAYDGVSGTMEFNESGVSITPDDVEFYLAVAGHTFLYKNKTAVQTASGQEAQEITLPPVVELYQYQNEYSPSNESGFRFWGWSKDGKVAYSYDFSDGGETASNVRIFNFFDNTEILDKSFSQTYYYEAGNDLDENNKKNEMIINYNAFFLEFSNACKANGIELVQAEYRQLPIVHNNKTYKVVMEIGKRVLNAWDPDFLVVDNYRIFVDTDGKRKVVREAEDEYPAFNIFLLGYFISPFENRALLVMGKHIIGGYVWASFVGCDLNSGFDTAAPVTFTVKEATEEKSGSSIYFFHDEDGDYYGITCSGTASGFWYISIGFNDDAKLIVEKTLYTIPQFSEDETFTFRWQSSLIPNRGISYMDGGQRKYFYLREDGMDGSVGLVEFKNSKQ